MARDVEELAIEDPTRMLAPERTDEELIRAIRLTDGRAFIGVKPAASGRSRQTGVFPAVSRAQMAAARESLEREAGVRILQAYSHLPILLVELDPKSAPKVRAHPAVNYLEAASAIGGGASAAASIASPVRFRAIAGLTAVRGASESIPWGVARVGAPTVWQQMGIEGEAATISVLDFSSDYYHLQVTGELPPTLHCISFVSQSPDCYGDMLSVHGAHVAGIALTRANSAGVIGVAPQIGSWRHYRVCDMGSCEKRYVIDAVNHILANPASRHIVNLSWGGATVFNDVSQSLSSLANSGVLLVAAAGNRTSGEGGPIDFPARHPGVMAVTGVLANDSFAQSFVCQSYAGTETMSSRYGDEAELAAPFVANSLIWSGFWGTDCGTSMAAPHVAGVAALLWTKYPHWSSTQIRQRLLESAEDLGPAGWDPKFGYGLVSATRALADSLVVSIDGPDLVQPGNECLWAAQVAGGSGGYTYEWSQNQHVVGTAATFLGSKDPGLSGSTYTLRVRVWAANGSVGAAELLITEDAWAMLCGS